MSWLTSEVNALILGYFGLAFGFQALKGLELAMRCQRLPGLFPEGQTAADACIVPASMTGKTTALFGCGAETVPGPPHNRIEGYASVATRESPRMPA